MSLRTPPLPPRRKRRPPAAAKVATGICRSATADCWDILVSQTQSTGGQVLAVTESGSPSRTTILPFSFTSLSHSHPFLPPFPCRLAFLLHYTFMKPCLPYNLRLVCRFLLRMLNPPHF